MAQFRRRRPRLRPAIADLTEDRLPPRTRATPRQRPGAEVVTYVLAGSLAQQDSAGRCGLVLAGEFRRAVVADGVRHGDGPLFEGLFAAMPGWFFALFLIGVVMALAGRFLRDVLVHACGELLPRAIGAVLGSRVGLAVLAASFAGIWLWLR